MNDNPEAIADAENAAENISFEDLIAQRAQTYLGSSEEETEDVDAVEQEESDETEPQQDEIDEEVDDDDGETEGPEVDLLTLSPEELQALAKKSKSRLLHRIGELTAKNKALEEAANSSQREARPLREGEQLPTHIQKLDSVDDLRSEYQKAQQVVEETDAILEEYEDYGSEDIITFEDGREYTKKDIRRANRAARDSMTKWLPARQQELALVEQRSAAERVFSDRLVAEIPEINDEESDFTKQHKQLMSDPLIEQVKKHVPDLAPQLPYLIGHALKNILRTQKLSQTKTATGTTAKAKVPSSPFGAASGRTTVGKKRVVEQAKQTLNKAHSVEDWIAARVALKSK